MNAPDNVQERARDLGFEVHGWDEKSGAVRGLPTSPYGGETFIGSHDEIRAYLSGFERCRRFGLGEIEKQLAIKATMRRSLLVVQGRAHPGDGLVTAHARPYVSFRGDRVAIPEEIARSFDVLDIRVGNRCQPLTSAEIRGEMFATRIGLQAELKISRDGALTSLIVATEAEAEFGRALSMDTCQPGMEITIVARQRDPIVPVTFEAMILGRTVIGDGG